MRLRCASVLAWICFVIALDVRGPHGQEQERVLPGHVATDDLFAGRWAVSDLRLAGELLFTAPYTTFDGAGRPGATGNPAPTRRPLTTGKPFLRTAGPDAASCSACHNQPFVGGPEISSRMFFAGTPRASHCSRQLTRSPWPNVDRPD